MMSVMDQGSTGHSENSEFVSNKRNTRTQVLKNGENGYRAEFGPCPDLGNHTNHTNQILRNRSGEMGGSDVSESSYFAFLQYPDLCKRK